MYFSDPEAARDPYLKGVVFRERWSSLLIKCVYINGTLKWDDALAAKAIVEAIRPESHGDYFMIRNEKAPPKEVYRTAGRGSTLDSVKPFERNADELRQPPEGTIYECNGIFDFKTMPRENLLYVACLYKTLS
ncbi:unnamed protein product [Haemonchus placei]|uniref:Uncharacterized protein n=1 Tax=Haemonchus placei TaxID=6290 RepID=A0A0N4X1B2_HAEPC|nr:unnamed protein product [Haemonchus placei]